MHKNGSGRTVLDGCHTPQHGLLMTFCSRAYQFLLNWTNVLYRRWLIYTKNDQKCKIVGRYDPLDHIYQKCKILFFFLPARRIFGATMKSKVATLAPWRHYYTHWWNSRISSSRERVCFWTSESDRTYESIPFGYLVSFEKINTLITFGTLTEFEINFHQWL